MEPEVCVNFPPAARQQQPGWYPALLQLIADAELAFIVDPIDGTENFTANLSLFGVMAAVRSAPRSISWLSTKMTERRSGPWADRKIDGRRG
jgi:Inositol monophosphatase family